MKLYHTTVDELSNLIGNISEDYLACSYNDRDVMTLMCERDIGSGKRSPWGGWGIVDFMKEKLTPAGVVLEDYFWEVVLHVGVWPGLDGTYELGSAEFKEYVLSEKSLFHSEDRDLTMRTMDSVINRFKERRTSEEV
jgi:hypothetical protein